MKRCLILFVTIMFACSPSKKSSVTSIDYTGPATIIYKTKNNYNDKVPVILSDDKTKIVSYPAPQDVYYNGKLALPTPLINSYLLDNRGISKNVAFLNITYDDYSKLSQAPTFDKMMAMIIDNNPLVEMYNCGNRHQYKDEVKDLNKIIEKKQLNKFKRIF